MHSRLRARNQMADAKITSQLASMLCPRPAAGTSDPSGRLNSTSLESLRSSWQSVAEILCEQHGLNPSLLGIVVTELVQPDGAADLPAGVQHFSQVQDWVVTTATQSLRMV